MSVLSRFRLKFPSVLVPAERVVVADDSGEVISELDDSGYEVLDSVPMAPPVRFNKEENMFDIHRRLIREELSRMAGENGDETFEEADDFDVEDDFDPRTPWEGEFDPTLREMTMRAVDEERMANGMAPRYFDDYQDEDRGEGAAPLPAEPEAKTPQAKPVSKAPKKVDTTGDNED